MEALDQRNTKENPFWQLREIVFEDLEKVNSRVLDLARSYASLIPEVTKYLLDAGGKRLRPMLTLASGMLVSGQEVSNNSCVDLAASVEFIHTATLLHDDVIDSSMKRRGKETANNIWGNKGSILVGDYLFSQAFELMVKTKSLDALQMLANASAVIAEAEVWQLDLIDNIAISQKEYIKMITSKTAVLFAAACASGAVVSGCTAEQKKALYNFGLNLGISFQIMDDVLDYSSANLKFGKQIGSDYYEGKVTLPLILAYDSATADEKSLIEQGMQNKKDEKSLHGILKLIDKYAGFTRSVEVAQSFADKGCKELAIFSDCDMKAVLESVIMYSVQRDF